MPKLTGMAQAWTRRVFAGNRGEERTSDCFLPDFCGPRMLITVVVIAELLAVVLALALPAPSGDRWNELALLSLLVQWIAVVSSAIFCLLRRPLCRLGNVGASLVGYFLILLVTAFFSLVGYGLLPLLEGFLWTGELVEDRLAFATRNVGIAAVIGALALRYFYVSHRTRRLAEAEAEARLQALQARIRPHFLFNAMNTIAALIPGQPEAAEEGVQDLADLFRASLNDTRRCISLTQELDLVRRYLHMEGLRLGERLRTGWQVDEVPGAARVPALILQPLVENAVYHGIEPSPAGGTVTIRGWVKDRVLHFRIENPLPPADPAVPREGNRIALANVRARLEAMHGDRAGLKVEKTGQRYRVHVYLPLETDCHEDPDR